MRNWLKKYRAYVIVVCIFVVVAAIVFFGFWINHAISVCGVMTKQAIANGYPASGWDCFDFWFSRYQTFIIGLLTLLAAIWAAIAVVQQNRIMRTELDAKQKVQTRLAREKATNLMYALFEYLNCRKEDDDSCRNRAFAIMSEICILETSAGQEKTADWFRVEIVKIINNIVMYKGGADESSSKTDQHIEVQNKILRVICYEYQGVQ